MRSNSIFSCIMTIISNFTIFFYLSNIYVQFFITNIADSSIFIWFLLVFFVNNIIFFFLKLIIFNACSLKDSQSFFMQSLPLYTSYLFYMVLNGDIVDIEKPDGICLHTFVVNAFSGLFVQSSIFPLNIPDLHK